MYDLWKLEVSTVQLVFGFRDYNIGVQQAKRARAPVKNEKAESVKRGSGKLAEVILFFRSRISIFPRGKAQGRDRWCEEKIGVRGEENRTALLLLTTLTRPTLLLKPLGVIIGMVKSGVRMYLMYQETSQLLVPCQP